MKIVISADCFASFTSGFPVRGMMVKLIKMRKDDLFILYYTKRPKPESLTDFYREIESLPNVKVRYFKYGRKMVAIRRLLQLSLIDKYDFDLFLNPGNPEVWSNARVPSICSIADFSTLKGLSTGKFAYFYKYYNRWSLKSLFSKITAIVPISEFTYNDLISFWPEYSSKMHVVHNGIDDMWFDSRVEKPDSMPFREKDYFIWWGLVSRRKNVDSLIKAYKLAKCEKPELPNLLIIGKIADYMEDIKDEFDENVVNIPFQDNYILKYLVRNSTGLIFPSFYEGFGLPVVEAFSQGVNVACSNLSSLPEVAGGHAFLFDPYNVEEIKKGILDMWQNKIEKQELLKYAQEFTYNCAACKYSNLIDSIL